ncbi:MAG TPA: S53 family peptidase [Candidatus Baltobacteraceae bacterium]|nr:S53 family peptidase [Candidatus Baltobacteraceae bacterium]
MKKLSAVALAAGILTASCSGHGGQSALPSAPGSTSSGGARPNATIAAPAGWSSTATQGVTVANASNLGALAPSQALTVRVALQAHNLSQLAQSIASGEKLSDAQLMAQYAPTSDEVSQVVSYLQSQGFTNVSVAANHLLVSADGTAAQAQKAFDTTLESFSLGAKNVFANTTPAFVPSSLGGIAIAVLGLNNAARMASGPTACFPTDPAPSGVPCVRSYDAHAIQTYYDAGTAPTGANTTAAVMAEGNVSQTVADLAYAEQQQGLPQVPVNVVKVGLSSPDTAGVGEWDLDTQSSTGIAGTVKALYIYDTTSLTDSDIANEYSHWESDDLAQLGNSSFGECEYQAYLDGSMRADDQTLMFAAAHGQTMFASSGDTGSSCALAPTNGVPGSGPPMVSFPASSPWVLAVGGTTVLSNNDETYLGETAWNSGGGGLSQFENAASWEEPVQLTTGIVAAGNLRGVPDVAMAADANSGAYVVYMTQPLVFINGTCSSPCAIGGTSEASPLSMGVYARMLSSHPSLGYAPPNLYHNYQKYEPNETLVQGPPPTESYGGFHDIVSGVNGAYSAAPGYDYTTGLGTFDISALNQTIAQ